MISQYNHLEPEKPILLTRPQPYLADPDDPTSEMHVTESPRLPILAGNQIYVELQMHRLMTRLVQVARCELETPRSQEILYAAEKHFWRHLGHPSCPVFPGELPNFLLESATVVQPMQASRLLEKIDSLTFPRPSSLSFAAKNMELLKSALNLNDRERELCIWSYCHERTRHSVLPDVAFESDRDSAQFFAKLFGVDENAMFRIFMSRRLPALRLLETTHTLSRDRRKVPGSLHSILSGSDLFINLIELPHITSASIVHQLLAPEFDTLLDSRIPIELDETLPDTFVFMYAQAQRGERLDAWLLAAMVDWITGIELPVESFHALDKKLHFETARQAIKLSAVRCCRAKRHLTETDLFFALYEAVNTDRTSNYLADAA